jgi:membrane associated rhomboid family serine protease
MALDLDPLAPAAPAPPSPFRRALRRRAATVATFIAILWIIWLVDLLLFKGSLVQHGIAPRTLRGLPGILWAPFLHASWSHLSGNTLGILMLGGLLIARYEAAFWAVSILGALATGIGTWIIGRPNAVHIGASGIIFAYFGYLLFAGIFERRISSLLLSLAVFLDWGSMLWSILPTAGTISWEGHLSGLAGGALAAKLLARKRADSKALPNDDLGTAPDFQLPRVPSDR